MMKQKSKFNIFNNILAAAKIYKQMRQTNATKKTQSLQELESNNPSIKKPNVSPMNPRGRKHQGDSYYTNITK